MATPFDGIGGLLGIDPAQLQQLMAQFAPSEDDRKAANMQALAQLGFGLLGTRKGYEWDQVGNAAQNALQARQGALQGAQQGKADQFKMAQGLAKYKQEQDAAQQAKVADTEIGALLQGGMSDEDKYRAYYKAAEIALRTGNVPKAKQYAEMAKELKPNFSQSPQIGVDENGKPYQFVLDNHGNEKRLSAGAKPDFAEVDLGGVKQFVNRYNLPSTGASFAKTVTPDALLSSETQRRGQNMTDARAREGNAIARDGTIAGKVGEFRKEFNSLPQVKAYGEVQPVLQSAREAVGTDTAAADLNLIYAAAKIMDPTSVVRESETQMVVGSGSPAQRFMGQFNYVAGGGRLTPAARKALMAEVESRGRGYESGYKAARKAYEGIAAKNGIPTDQVFIEPFAPSLQPQQQKQGGLTPAEEAELLALKKKLGRQ